jgi:hypothetical protein
MTYLSVEDTFQYLDKLPNGNLIEFGVFSGNCLNRLIKGAENVGKPFEEIYGFDSWIGLPKENEYVWQNPEWPEKAFSLCNDFQLNNNDDAMRFVREKVERKDINLISGFFSESLTEKLGQKLQNTASYLHIDCDIYQSSFEVLDWILKYQIAKIGSLFRFDDFNSTPYGEGGQSLALIQCIQKYKFKYQQYNNILILNSYE